MRDATARQQEGELLAARRMLARCERQQQALVEQLAAERQQLAAAGSELQSLRAMAAQYDTMRERHAAALEMLGEKDEELDAMRGARAAA